MSKRNLNTNEKDSNPIKFGVIVIVLVVFVILIFFLGIIFGAYYAQTHHDFLLLGSIDHNDVGRGNGALLKTNRILTRPLFQTNVTTSISPLSRLRGSNTVAKVITPSNEVHAKVEVQKQENIASMVVLESTPILRQSSLFVTENSYMITPSTTNLDNGNILIAAWIYLDDSSVTSLNYKNMRTVFSNKAPGCEKNPDQYGISMYINAWETNDQKLYVEYGNADSGCHKITAATTATASGDNLLNNNQWYHVAVYFNKDGSHVLLLNGKVIQSQVTSSSNSNVALLPTHAVQSNRPFIVGNYEKGIFPLYGNISHFSVSHFDWKDLAIGVGADTGTVDAAGDANSNGIIALEEETEFEKLSTVRTYVKHVMNTFIPLSIPTIAEYLQEKQQLSQQEKSSSLPISFLLQSHSPDVPLLVANYMIALYPFTDTTSTTSLTTTSSRSISTNKINAKPAGDVVLSSEQQRRYMNQIKSVSHEVIHHRHGKYIFPSSSSYSANSNNNDNTQHYVSGAAATAAGVKFPLINGLDNQPYDLLLTAADTTAFNTKCLERKNIIKKSMKDVWTSYKAFAWGYDELKPVSKRGENNWGGIGMTILDTLDTLFVMDMLEEFGEAVKWVADSLSFHHADKVSMFETTIRALGGLLSAYDLSKEKILLTKAVELGELLFPAFQTSTGIPYSTVSFRNHHGSPSWNGNDALLAELGTLQIEFRALAYFTHNMKYEQISMKALQLMEKKHPAHGLYPMKVNIQSGAFADTHVTLGAMGDSFYEYLLKLWIQGGKKETWLRRMYDDAVNGIIEVLLQKSSGTKGYAYIADWDMNSYAVNSKMDHLVCFLPGILALGAYTHPQGLQSLTAQRDLAVAKALMYTCYSMYPSTPTHISPEYMDFPRSTSATHRTGGTGGSDMSVPESAPFYILRPETAESLFVLAQLTNESIYREWAWELFLSIEQNCKVIVHSGGGNNNNNNNNNGGNEIVTYAALRDVRNKQRGLDDRMESFFLAETMKYLYLAQDTSNVIDVLNTYVFNTEAHPIRIFDDSHIPVPP